MSDQPGTVHSDGATSDVRGQRSLKRVLTVCRYVSLGALSLAAVQGLIYALMGTQIQGVPAWVVMLVLGLAFFTLITVIDVLGQRIDSVRTDQGHDHR